MRADEGGFWVDFCPERRTKLQIEGVGFHSWLLERRRELARGIHSRRAADGCLASMQIFSDVQWRLKTLHLASGYSAHQLVFGSNAVDLASCGDDDRDYLFAQDTSSSGQSVKRCELRRMAQEAAPQKVVKSKLRRLLAYNKSFKRTGVQMCDSVL